MKIEYVQLGKYIKEYNSRNKKLQCKDVYSVTNTQGFVSSNEYFNKEVYSKNLSNYKFVCRNMIAYNPSRVNVGSLAVQNKLDLVIVSPLYIVFEIVKNTFIPEFVSLFLHSCYGLAQIDNLTSGSVRDSLKYSALEKIKLPIYDIDKQEKIISNISYVDKLIYKCNKQLTLLDELTKSRFIEMFGIESEFDKWSCCAVSDVADVCVGVVIKPTQYYVDKGIPAFRSLNIGKMCVNDSDWVYFTDEGHQKNKKSVVHKNDVLVVRSGAPGTACVVTEKYDGYNAVDIIIVHPDNEKVNSVFLAAFTNMPHGMNQIREKTGGAAQQHFNVGGYKSMRIIMPPINLQNQFADFVTQTDKSKYCQEKCFKFLRYLAKNMRQELL